MAPGNPNVDGRDFDTCHRLSRIDSFTNRAHRPFDVTDNTFAQAAACHVANAKNLDTVGIDFGDDGRYLGAAQVEPDNDLRVRGGWFRHDGSATAKASTRKPGDELGATLPWPSVNGQVSGSRLAHAHDDTLGMSAIVEKHHANVALRTAQFAQNSLSHGKFFGPGPCPKM